MTRHLLLTRVRLAAMMTPFWAWPSELARMGAGELRGKIVLQTAGAFDSSVLGKSTARDETHRSRTRAWVIDEGGFG